MDVILAQPRGFCAGVVRAIDIVELALEIHGPPVFVFHEIVHNHYVVQDLQKRGAVFVESLDNVPSGSVTIFSAHGVSTAIVDQAKQMKLDIIDATCPLVTKVHLQAKRYSKDGHTIIIIGHAGHEEVEGTLGSVDGPVFVISTVEDVEELKVDNPNQLAYVTQTTLSIDDTYDVIDALKARYPKIKGPELNDICYATQNRQNAVRKLAKTVDMFLVVGARNSSNSNRLREVGEQLGVQAYLIQDENEIDHSWFKSVKKVGITAGASAPEILVKRVLEKLDDVGISNIVEMDGIQENTAFRLPKKLTTGKNQLKQENLNA